MYTRHQSIKDTAGEKKGKNTSSKGLIKNKALKHQNLTDYFQQNIIFYLAMPCF